VLHWVTQAVQTRRTTVVRLRRTLEARSRHSRRRFLEELLADVAEGVESPLELRYLRDVERAHGLPQGVRQHVSRSRDRRDVVYREYGLVVELDGRLGHEGLGRFRDMRRDNRATVDGESTLRYGSVDVTWEPCLVARQVAEVLVLRGWRSEFRLCTHCALTA
jgi:very-short-patch-repair endonuclease